MSFPLYGLLTVKRAVRSGLPKGAVLYDIRGDVAVSILRFYHLAWDSIAICVPDGSGGYATKPILKDDLVLIAYNYDLEGYPVVDLVAQAERVSDLTRLAGRADAAAKIEANACADY